MSTASAVQRTKRGSIPSAAGVGLRFQHHQAVVDTRPEVAWLEGHTENYLGGGRPAAWEKWLWYMTSATALAFMYAKNCVAVGP